jgi:hypothetical protein
MKPLVADIEKWARDNVETAKKEEVSKRFTAGEWVIELDLYAGGDESDPAPGAIGVADLRGGIITAHQDLRKALDEKSKRYGTLDAPYLIVVADAKDQLFTKESIEAALTDAVLGDEIIQFQGGKARITRAKNGFWHGKNGPRNRHVSGVLLLPRTDLWKLREDKWQPILATNPWAERALPPELRTLQRFEAEGDRWRLQEGKAFADVLGMPTPLSLPQTQNGLTVDRESVDSCCDGRSLQADLARCGWIVPVARCTPSRNPGAATPAQRAAA